MKFFNILKKHTQVPELGVELELEGFRCGFQAQQDLPKSLYQKYILEQTIDESVLDDATEIVFKHYPLVKWNPNEIDEILKTFTEYGLHAGSSAGMHIHYSGPNIERIYAAHERDQESFYNSDCPGFLTTVLNNIGARTGYFNGAYVHGVDLDTWDTKFKDTKTIEIRAFESTTNPNIFYLRLSVVNYLMNYLSRVTYKTAQDRLFQDMPHDIKNQYWILSSCENPNRYGWKRDVITQKLFGQTKGTGR